MMGNPASDRLEPASRPLLQDAGAVLAKIGAMSAVLNWKIVAMHRYDAVDACWISEPLPGETAAGVKAGQKDRRHSARIIIISATDEMPTTSPAADFAAEERVLILHGKDMVAALDTAEALGLKSHAHLFLGQPSPDDIRIVRVEQDGLSPVDFGVDVERHPLAQDFSQILAARRLLRRTAKGSADHGREAARSWIKSLGGQPHPDVAISEPDAVIRIFTPRECINAPILYIHGGGLVHYDLDVFTPFLTSLATMLSAAIHAVSYRKCPEVDPGVVIDEIVSRVRSVALNAGVQRIMGDSIGGLLALYAAARILPGHFREAVLLYPVLSLRRTFPSYEVYGDGYLLDENHMRWFRSLAAPRFLSEDFDPVGGLRGELDGMRVNVVSAGCDVLADEVFAFVRASGADHVHHPDLPHDFCLYLHRMPSATAAVAEIANSLSKKF